MKIICYTILQFKDKGVKYGVEDLIFFYKIQNPINVTL